MTQSNDEVVPLQQIQSLLLNDAATGQAAEMVGQLRINYADFAIDVACNCQQILSELAAYFRRWVDAAPTKPAARTIRVVNSEAVLPPLSFTDWQRDPGKTGSAKDSFFDYPEHNTRVIRKVRTGMVFLQSDTVLIANGPCLDNSNQVINFVNHQLLNVHLHRGSLLCHAAALSIQGRGIGVAGFSGGGKSTTMLHLLDFPDSQFISNDRAFIYPDAEGVSIAGIPKMPRINPGTIVHNPKLQSIIDEERRQTLLAMPVEVLWDLEEKYDADVEQIWGANAVTDSAPLDSFFILNWQRDAREKLAVQQVDPAERRDLLPAVMKSFGCFYQHADGHFDVSPHMSSEEEYIRVFHQTRFYEVAGRVDFDALKSWFQQHFAV